VAFNIHEFKGVIDQYGGNSRLSLFEVILTSRSLDNRQIVPGGITDSDLRFFCQSVSVPGINLDTTPYRTSGVGMPESMPMTVQPEALNCVFMLDSNHSVMSFFHRWISNVMNVSGARGDNSRGLPMHQIEYKNSYAAKSLVVRHYSSHNTSRFYEFQYLGVYPTQVSNIDLAWSSKDQIATITVNFSYSKMLYSGFSNTSFEVSQIFEGLQKSVAQRGEILQNITDNITRITA
jgi:hypothetical protein